MSQPNDGTIVIQDAFIVEGAITGWSPNSLSSCGGESMIGGSGVFGNGGTSQKTFSGLPAHYGVVVSFRAYFIDSWDSEYFHVYADGNEIYVERWVFTPSPLQFCGQGNFNDIGFDRSTNIFAHTANTITISFSAALNEDAANEAIGLNSLQIVLFPCDTSCATCYGPSTNNCASCTGTTYLNPFTNACVSTCPTGYYPDTSTKRCKQCYQFSETVPTDQTCSTCNGGNSNNCLSCYGSAFFDTSTGKCLTTCGTGKWYDAGGLTCRPCYTTTGTDPQSCATCSAGGATDCITCLTGNYYDTVSATCVSACPAGYFAYSSVTPNNVCHLCYKHNIPESTDLSCNACTGGNSNNCQTCFSPLLFDTSTYKCVVTCPIGWYHDISTSSCLQCYQAASPTATQQSCYTCIAGTATSCTSCAKQTYLYTSIAGSECLLSCPDGWYPDGIINECIRCYQYSAATPTENTCLQCNGPSFNNCTACATGTFLDSLTNKCVNICPDGYWGNTASNTCDLCYFAPPASPDPEQNCKTCIGGNSNDCVTCNFGNYLFLSNTTCLTSCPDGWFPNSTTHTCDPCYQGNFPTIEQTCATCDGSQSTNCLSCTSGTYYFPENRTCLIACPSGYYYNISNQICELCFQATIDTDPLLSCLTCTGPLATDCLTCYPGTYLFPTNTSCMESCPGIGWYPIPNQNSCGQCYAPPNATVAARACLTCQGPESTDCITCFPGTYLLKTSGECLKTCPDGMYNGPSDWACELCSNPNQDDTVASISPCNGEYLLLSQISLNLMRANYALAAVIPLFMRGSSLSTILLGFHITDLDLFRYINVHFPANFEIFIGQIGFNNIIPNPFTLMLSGLSSSSNIGKFKYWLATTSFLDYSGVFFLKEFVLLLLAGIAALVGLALGAKGKKGCASYVIDLFCWNLFVTYFLADFANMFSSSVLQIREFNSESVYNAASLAVSVIVIVGYAFLHKRILFILNRESTEDGTSNTPFTPMKWTKVSSSLVILEKPFRFNNLFRRNFILALLSVQITVISIIFFVQDFGFFQAGLYAGIHAVSFLAVCIFLPLNGFVEYLILLVNLAWKTALGSLALCIGIDDFLLTWEPETRNAIGVALIYLYLVSIILNTVLAVLALLWAIYRLIWPVQPKPIVRVATPAPRKKVAGLQAVFPGTREIYRPFQKDNYVSQSDHVSVSSKVSKVSKPEHDSRSSGSSKSTKKRLGLQVVYPGSRLAVNLKKKKGREFASKYKA